MRFSIEFKSDSGKNWEHIEFEELGNFREASYYVGQLEKRGLVGTVETNGQFRAVPVKKKVKKTETP